MLLAIDIGNTMVSLGVMKKKKVESVYSLSKSDLPHNLGLILQGIQKEYDIESCIICSVVPSYTRKIATSVKKYLQVEVSVVGQDIDVPIKNKYKDPVQVGQDRLVGAYAAWNLYGSPLIIIDFGTAITLDVISKKGEYEGGIIAPGIRLSAESLFKNTALLPQVKEVVPPKKLIGRDTESSMMSGIFNGYGSMCSCLVTRLSKEIKAKPKVILTGGYAKVMKKFLICNVTVEQQLVLKGMSMLS